MHYNMKYIIFGCVLLLVILTTMTSSCGAMPYANDTRSYALFEGYRGISRKQRFDEKLTYFINKLKEEVPSTDLEYINPELDMIDRIRKTSPYNIKEIKQQLTIVSEKFIKNKETRNKMEDFMKKEIEPIIESERKGLLINSKKSQMQMLQKQKHMRRIPQKQMPPTRQGFTTMSVAEHMTDIFSSAVGDLNCVKTASGLSNSMGPLCLSKEQLYMLQSRGGNSSGLDSQIG